MRRVLALAALSLAALPASAQQESPPQDCPDQLTAMGGELTDQLQTALRWRLQAIQDERKIAELQAELAKGKAK